MAPRRIFRKRKLFRRKRVVRRARVVRRRVLRRRAPLRRASRSEVKQQTAYNLGLSLKSSASGSFGTTNQFALGPNASTLQIAQGVQNGYRIGNRVTTKSLRFKGTIYPKPYNATTNVVPIPTQVRMIVYYDRQHPNDLPNPVSDMFQLGNVNQGFLNDLTDMWRPYNTDRYRILMQRTFKVGNSIVGGQGSAGQYQSFANNDFKLNCNFNINLTKYYPRIVRFDENALQPTTRSLFVLFYLCAASGDPLSSSQEAVTVEYMIDYKYTDD